MPEESRLERKVDRVLEQQTEVLQRLVKVETLIHERTDDTQEMRDKMKTIEDRLGELEKHKTQVISFKDIATWVAMAAIAILEVMK